MKRFFITALLCVFIAAMAPAQRMADHVILIVTGVHGWGAYSMEQADMAADYIISRRYGPADR